MSANQISHLNCGDVFVQGGAIEFLFTLLVESSSTAERACHTIGAMARIPNQRFSELCSEHGGVEKLLGALKKHGTSQQLESESLASKACAALALVLKGSADNMNAMADNNGIDVVLKVMSSHLTSQSVQGTGFHLLSMVATGLSPGRRHATMVNGTRETFGRAKVVKLNQALKTKMLAAGGLKAAVDTISAHVSIESVLVPACETLIKLTRHLVQ